ncbi:MAG: hypothetical protein ACRBCL_00635 [Maritimibacter sp.]
MPAKTPVVIFLYNRFFDPLVQGNFWLFIKDYLEDEDAPVRFHVITFEDENFPLTPEQLAQVDIWRDAGLEWTPLDWHPGMGLATKLRDVFAGFLTLAKLRAKGWKHIIAFCAIAGAFSYLCATVLRMRLFIHSYEPHSEISRDAGAWSEESKQYKITRILEKRSAKFAHVIASGTRFMGDRLNKWKARATFFRIPSVVNDTKFSFDPEARRTTRKSLGIEQNQSVVLYTGKFGGLYYGIETARAFSCMLEHDPSLHMLIVSPNAPEDIQDLFDQAKVPAHRYSICQSSYDEIERYYSAGDIGLITIPPGPGQKFRSSIKVGEYLCAGMPFLTSTGVSEDYIHAQEQDVGVVVDSFDDACIHAAWPEIERYFEESPDEKRQRCRSFGVSYRGFSSLNPVFKSAVSALIER